MLTANLNQTECDGDQESPNKDADPGIELTMDLGTPSENWSQDCSKLRAIELKDKDMPFHRPWVDHFRFWHKDKLEEGSLTYTEETGLVFKEPSWLTFNKWRFLTDRSRAYALIDQFSPVDLCELCFTIKIVENTEIEIR